MSAGHLLELSYPLAALRQAGLVTAMGYDAYVRRIVFPLEGNLYDRSISPSTEMLRAGVHFPVLMKLLGHTCPEMTMRYLDVAARTSSGSSNSPDRDLDTSCPNRQRY